MYRISKLDAPMFLFLKYTNGGPRIVKTVTGWQYVYADGARRIKRSEDAIFEPARSTCIKEGGKERIHDTEQMIHNAALWISDGEMKERRPNDPEERICICAFDRDSGDAFPCREEEKWGPPDSPDGLCHNCDKQHSCFEDTAVVTGSTQPCTCANIVDTRSVR